MLTSSMYGGGYPPPIVLESDDELRSRLRYVCGTSDGRLARSIEASSGPALDAIAEEFNLRRRSS